MFATFLKFSNFKRDSFLNSKDLLIITIVEERWYYCISLSDTQFMKRRYVSSTTQLLFGKCTAIERVYNAFKRRHLRLFLSL
jgi:hypothetical protein